MSVKALINYESVPMSEWMKTFIGFLVISLTILFSPKIISAYLPSMNSNEKLIINIIFCIAMLYYLFPILKLLIPLVTAKLFGTSDISIDNSIITIIRNNKIKTASWDKISKIKREIMSGENYIIPETNDYLT